MILLRYYVREYRLSVVIVKESIIKEWHNLTMLLYQRVYMFYFNGGRVEYEGRVV
jgi:hypothetical protein